MKTPRTGESIEKVPIVQGLSKIKLFFHFQYFHIHIYHTFRLELPHHASKKASSGQRLQYMLEQSRVRSLAAHDQWRLCWALAAHICGCLHKDKISHHSWRNHEFVVGHGQLIPFEPWIYFFGPFWIGRYWDDISVATKYIQELQDSTKTIPPTCEISYPAVAQNVAFWSLKPDIMDLGM